MRQYLLLSRNQGSPCREEDHDLLRIMQTQKGWTMNSIIVPSNDQMEQQVVGIIDSIEVEKVMSIDPSFNETERFFESCQNFRYIAIGTSPTPEHIYTEGSFYLWYVGEKTSDGKNNGDFPDGVGLIFANPMSNRDYKVGDHMFCHMRNMPNHTDKALEIECIGTFTGKVLFGWWMFDLTHPVEDMVNPSFEPRNENSEIAKAQYDNNMKFFGDTWDAQVYYD